MQTTIKITSVMPSSAAAAGSLVKASLSASKRKIIKLQQFIQLMVIIVAINCLKIDLTTALSEEEMIVKTLADSRNKCIKQNGLSAAQETLIFDHKLFTPSTTLATTPKAMQCYCLCFMNESNIFAQDKPNEAYLRSTLPLLINDAEKANAALDKCLKKGGEDKCEFAFNFELCLVREAGVYM